MIPRARPGVLFEWQCCGHGEVCGPVWLWLWWVISGSRTAFIQPIQPVTETFWERRTRRDFFNVVMLFNIYILSIDLFLADGAVKKFLQQEECVAESLYSNAVILTTVKSTNISPTCCNCQQDMFHGLLWEVENCQLQSRIQYQSTCSHLFKTSILRGV